MVPVLSSGVYGHRKVTCDPMDRKNCRVISTNQFSSQTGISYSLEKSYGGVLPA